MALSVKVDRRTSELDGVANNLRGGRAHMAVLGKRMEKDLRSHFLRKNGEPNKNGWPKSNFWTRRIRANTSLTNITPRTATVTIAAPEMAQKLYGGTIRPRESKYLALPAVAAAKGRSPRVFSGLHFEPRRGRKVKGALVNESGVTMYRLVTEVTQQPDPPALPKQEELEGAMNDETNRFLARRDRRA